MPDFADPLNLPEVMILTLRERELVRGLLSGLSNADAMRRAKYAESYIRTRAGAVCRSDRIILAIRAAMADAGITAEALASTMKAGLKATNDKGLPDHAIRHRFLETAIRVGGFEPSREDNSEETYEEQIIRLRGIERQ